MKEILYLRLIGWQKIFQYGGIKEIYCVGRGTMISWGVGFAIGAIHFKRGYVGGIDMQFRNAAEHRAHWTAQQSPKI